MLVASASTGRHSGFAFAAQSETQLAANDAYAVHMFRTSRRRQHERLQKQSRNAMSFEGLE